MLLSACLLFVSFLILSPSLLFFLFCLREGPRPERGRTHQLWTLQFLWQKITHLGCALSSEMSTVLYLGFFTWLEESPVFLVEHTRPSAKSLCSRRVFGKWPPWWLFLLLPARPHPALTQQFALMAFLELPHVPSGHFSENQSQEWDLETWGALHLSLRWLLGDHGGSEC